ncbi:MAG: carbohydrate-binding domain-containing protein [Alkalibacterium sp.]|nr:carbohydrate-binding domain-containing protein [Alkalibacterium sp.]
MQTTTSYWSAVPTGASVRTWPLMTRSTMKTPCTRCTFILGRMKRLTKVIRKAPQSDRPNVMSNARYALENDVALFATEWGTSEADGNNGPFLDEADAWLQFLNDNNISWSNWSLTNKNETSGAFTPFELGKTAATDLDPGEDHMWSAEELSKSGEYVRARIKGIPYDPIDRNVEGYSEVIWDFNDGTEQGFVVNPGGPALRRSS